MAVNALWHGPDRYISGEKRDTQKRASCFEQVARFDTPHCQKWDCHALPLFALDRAFEAVFNFYLNSRRDQKRARQIHALERVAILFLGCDMTLGTHPAASKKFARNHETTKGRKDDINIHVLNWEGPPLEVQIPYTFPTQKLANKSKFSDLLLRILRFLAESSGVTKLFFRPSPSRLSPGRNTVFVPVERIVQRLASFPLWGIKREHGPIHSPGSPSAMQLPKTKNKQEPKRDHKQTQTKQTKPKQTNKNKHEKPHYRSSMRIPATYVLMIKPCLVWSHKVGTLSNLYPL